MKKIFLLFVFLLTFLFVESGNAKQHVWIEQDWLNEEWVNVSRDITNYENDNITDATFQDWAGNDWINDSRISYTYNTKGQITNYLYEIYENSMWSVYMKMDYFYEGDNLVKTDMYADDEGELVLSASNRFSYNAKGLLVLDEFYQIMGGVEMLFTKNEYSYDAKDREIEAISFMLDFMTSELIENEKTTTFYENNSNNPSIIVEYSWIEEDWLESMRTRYAYNAADYQIEEIQQMWNDDWENWQRTETLRNNNNYETQVINQLWNGSDWENNSKLLYEYNNDDLTREVYQLWNAGDWENTDETLYYYDNDGLYLILERVWSSEDWVNSSRYLREGASSVNISSNTVNIDVYPNPTQSVLNVAFSLEHSSYVKANIYSMDAKSNTTVINGFFEKGTQNEVIELSNLTNGTYIINFLIGRNNFIKKFVISK